MPKAYNPLLAARPPAHCNPYVCAGDFVPEPAASSARDTGIDRRAFVRGAAAGTAALALSALAGPGGAAAAPPQAVGGVIGYAFNVGSKDVTLFDPATRRAIETRPLGAQVRWLNGDNHYWDGRHIWTYDFPENKVQAIAIDPRAVTVARTIPTGGGGPAFSIELTPDRRTGWITVAGDDQLAVLDIASGQVIDKIQTGDFP